MQPESVADALVRELDRSRPVSELRLHAIVRECRAKITKVSSQQAAYFYYVTALAYWRLCKFDRALEASGLAARILSQDAGVVGTYGAALVVAGRYAEGVEQLVKALQLEVQLDKNTLLTLSNLAEALWHLGDREGAMEAFREARAAARKDNADDLLLLANQAAEIGAFRDALRLFAGYLSARRNVVVRADEVLGYASLDGDEQSMINPLRGLRRMLVRIDDGGGPRAVEMMLRAPVARAERSSEGALAVFEETKAMRGHANSAVLGLVDES